MNSRTLNWYSIGAPNSTIIRCASCGYEVDLLFPELDHHPRVCPSCGVECAFLDWKGTKIIQIVPKNAPPVIAKLVQWMQENLSELEYVELVIAFEEISHANLTCV